MSLEILVKNLIVALHKKIFILAFDFFLFQILSGLLNYFLCLLQPDFLGRFSQLGRLSLLVTGGVELNRLLL
jgi:hypothetical protein